MEVERRVGVVVSILLTPSRVVPGNPFSRLSRIHRGQLLVATAEFMIKKEPNLPT